MAAVEEESLESLLNKATNPANHEEDWEFITRFCDQINKELEGPQIAIRLIAHKVQSPQEREALFALTTVESCVKNCGRRFHQELGKFRFLNEMIKVVSPKYLADRTTGKVKKRTIELIYSWSKGLPHEAKVLEAYQMLKAQGIVKEDPTYVDKTLEPPPPARPRNALFEDEEKSKLLARLLKSKHPEDLQAANRLIKNMVKQDAEKMEKAAKRINELETINNNVKVLEDMLNLYSPSTSESEKEMMKEMYDTLEKHRPNLFRLASDADEKDGSGITDILKANDSVMKVMAQYKKVVDGEPSENGAHDPQADTLLDLTFDPSHRQTDQSEGNTTDTSNALLSEQLSAMGLNTPSEATPPTSFTQLNDLFGGLATPPAQNQPVNARVSAPGPFSAAPQPHINAGLFSQPGSLFPTTDTAFSTVLAPPPPSAGTTTIHPHTKAMEDLDLLGQSLIKQNMPKEPPIIQSPAPQKLTLNQIQAKSQPIPPSQPAWMIPSAGQPTVPPVTTFTAPLTQNTASPIHMAPGSPAKTEIASLANITVPLESIQPSEIPSLNAYDKDGIKIVLHFAKGRPREDVGVVVVSVMTTLSTAVKGLVFQAAVPKTMRVKLQPPSATDLPAYNPILPPSAITQVMLLANPHKERVRLKFKLTYNLNEESLSDVGDVENFPEL